MADLLWLPDVLRAAGVSVVEHARWRARRNGDLWNGPLHVVWHHDASPAGDSPGVPAYMARQMDAGAASAQVWVDRTGAWHLIGSGRALHAGAVLAGMPGNHNSIGVETDHTVGERWPARQLDGLHRGTAAVLARTGGALHFHKTICAPRGRKVDPDGLDLATERAAVAALAGGDDMFTDADRAKLDQLVREQEHQGRELAKVKVAVGRLDALRPDLAEALREEGVTDPDAVADRVAARLAAGIAVEGRLTVKES